MNELLNGVVHNPVIPLLLSQFGNGHSLLYSIELLTVAL